MSHRRDFSAAAASLCAEAAGIRPKINRPGATCVRPFEGVDRLACQIIAAQAALSSYAPAMPDLAHTFDGQAPLETVDRRWVAVQHGRLIGFVDVVGNHIANLFVDPAAQGGGVGTLLIDVVERNTCGDLTLSVFTVNPRARTLYERLGFSMVAERDVSFRGSSKAVWSMKKSRAAGPYRLIVFDFDGVLANTAEWMLNTLPVVCAEFGLPPTSRQTLEALRGAPTREIVRALHIPAWKVPTIARRMRRLSAAEAGAISLFPGVRELIENLAHQGIPTAVVSSNGEVTIRAVLGDDLATSFQHLDCGVALFGKAARLRRLARAAGVPPGVSLYVGDETRDVEAAARAGFRSAAASWGYATRAALIASSPTIIVDSVEELAAALGATATR